MSDETTKRYMTTVYSALFGPYDDPPPALYGGILFTDQDIQPDGWTVKRVERPHPDPTRASRYYFCQSCLVLPDREITVQVVGNAQPTMPPDDLVKRFLPDDFDIACFAHPHRTSVYEEGYLCGCWRKDDPRVIKRQMDRYRAEGFLGDDLSACTLLIRRNTLRIREFEGMWWNEVLHGSVRNQLSFDYCRWKLDLPVARIPGNLFKSGHILKMGRHL